MSNSDNDTFVTDFDALVREAEVTEAEMKQEAEFEAQIAAAEQAEIEWETEAAAVSEKADRLKVMRAKKEKMEKRQKSVNKIMGNSINEYQLQKLQRTACRYFRRPAPY